MFDEGDFPFAQLHPNAGAQLRKDVILLPSHLLNAKGLDFIDQFYTNSTNDLEESGHT